MALLDSPSAYLETLGVESQRGLNEHFRFDLSDHGLIDPNSNKGFVSDITEQGNVDFFGHTVSVKEVRVVDPFVAADPEGYARVRDHVQKMESTVRAYGYDPLVERQQRYPYSRDTDSTQVRQERRKQNQFTQAWLHDPNVAALKAWHGLIPSALALGHLTNPWLDRTFETDQGTILTSPETAAHLRHVDDAVAIRDRAVAIQAIASDHLKSVGDTSKPVQWLELASGTAEPAISAAKQVSDEQGLDIELTVVDHDPDALKFVEANAAAQGFKGKITPVTDFITVPTFVDNLPHHGEGHSVVADAGWKEYMPERDQGDGLGRDELGAFKDVKILPNASDFTRWAYGEVEPGGAYISGNMVLDRPQRDFVFGIVNWPIINARSEESMMRIYKRAGILDDPNSIVEMFRVRDELTDVHIYTIIKATKLDESGHGRINGRKLHIPSQALGLSA